MGGEAARKQRHKDGIADVEPTRIGAESRQDGSPPIAREAPAAQRTPACRDPRDGMEMAGDFAEGLTRRRLVAERYGADRQARGRGTRKAVRLGIVVAGDPDDLAAMQEIGERIAVLRCEARRRVSVVETVAEEDEA